MAKMEEQDSTEVDRLTAYVLHHDGYVTEDYYWTDHDITPTRFYRWLQTYNSHNKCRRSWASKVMLDDRVFDSLTSMLIDYEPKQCEFSMDGVEITPQRSRQRL